MNHLAPLHSKNPSGNSQPEAIAQSKQPMKPSLTGNISTINKIAQKILGLCVVAAAVAQGVYFPNTWPMAATMGITGLFLCMTPSKKQIIFKKNLEDVTYFGKEEILPEKIIPKGSPKKSLLKVRQQVKTQALSQNQVKFQKLQNQQTDIESDLIDVEKELTTITSALQKEPRINPMGDFILCPKQQTLETKKKNLHSKLLETIEEKEALHVRLDAGHSKALSAWVKEKKAIQTAIKEAKEKHTEILLKMKKKHLSKKDRNELSRFLLLLNSGTEALTQALIEVEKNIQKELQAITQRCI